MTKPQSARRGRGRSPKRNKPGNSGRNDFRGKGNPKQLLDKYKSLARDAMQSGDRVLAENYFQHADHYQRVLNERNGVMSGVYEEPAGASPENSDGQDEAKPPRRKRSRSQRSEEAAAVEAEQQPQVDTDPRRRTEIDGPEAREKPAAPEDATSSEESGRVRRQRRGVKTARAKDASDEAQETATDTAAE